MLSDLMNRYGQWLHLQWPGGSTEPLPEVNPDHSTSVPGLYVVGELTGIPLLKHAVDSGARVVRQLVSEVDGYSGEAVPLVIVGGGVSGLSAALEAHRLGLKYEWLESHRLLETVENYPQGKPIYTEPPEMIPDSSLNLPSSDPLDREGLLQSLLDQAKEKNCLPRYATLHGIRKDGHELCLDLLEKNELRAELRAHRVILAIGRSGEHRKLDVHGENLQHVSHRCHDPALFVDQQVVVVGGGDTACETVLSLARAGAQATLCHKQGVPSKASARLRLEIDHAVKAGLLKVVPQCTVAQITENDVMLTLDSGETTSIPAQAVFTMLGRKPPLELLKRCGLRIQGEKSGFWWGSFAACMIFFFVLYHWKREGVWIPIAEEWKSIGGFPAGLDLWWSQIFTDPQTLAGSLTGAMDQPGFWYSLLYTALVFIFGIRRIRRRPAPYIRKQTWCLFWIQAIPLFLLPYMILPWLGNNGVFDSGWGKSMADSLFPAVGESREYWRSFGLILAWPLFFWNVFTNTPMGAWLVISLIQTFVLLPLAIRRWGKGVYCGWICSCGALAETLGDAHRKKMPKGDLAKKWNFVGQFFLLLCMIMLVGRGVSWLFPDSSAGVLGIEFARGIQNGIPLLNYEWFVDLFCSGILGVGLYWHFSGRTWCRFACPLAALMNIYARFSRFRIFAEKSRCISCNVCTATCHQGIDVMTFARQGIPMEDPQCVRCGACVHDCPTDVLRFGRLMDGGMGVHLDLLSARSGISGRSVQQGVIPESSG